jgi:hypothetical protein
MQNSSFYNPKEDPIFTKPFIDKEEWRKDTFSYLYVHGGFEGTNVKFTFCFPEKEKYQGRFFHIVAPVQGNEDATLRQTGEENHMLFAVSHGAYFIESNMGGNDPDPTMLYRSSAAVAEYSREVARRLFRDHRPYGYVFGGSGGGFKTIACMQNTEGVWDGSVPFVIGSPLSIPNMFTVRVHAMRLLRKKWDALIDALEPGGSGDVYALLNEEEEAAFTEATRMGFPPKAWFAHERIGAGALPVLTYAIDQMDSSYYTDFWTKPGYLGTADNSSAVRDRFRFETSVNSITLPDKGFSTGDMGVDEAWQTLAIRYGNDPFITLANEPDCPGYIDGTKVIFLSGALTGLKLPLGTLKGNIATIGTAFGMGDVAETLKAVCPGDKVALDNSDYIALQTYHRHQVSDRSYIGWEQFRDENGEPVYPQRPMLVGPIVANGGAGSVQSGQYSGKMIVVASLLDESAFPWQADWYRRRVEEHLGDNLNDRFRLWYMDNAMHGDAEKGIDETHIISYVGALHQALIDVSTWAEKGVAPLGSTAYSINDSQMSLPVSADKRSGIQPVVALSVSGEKKMVAKAKEKVSFKGVIDLPADTGRITTATWDFEGLGSFSVQGTLKYLDEKGEHAEIMAEYAYEKQGVYFPVLRISANRQGDTNDIYTQVKNLDRVRIIVE